MLRNRFAQATLAIALGLESACGGATATPAEDAAAGPDGADASDVLSTDGGSDASLADPCLDAGTPEACAAIGPIDPYGVGACSWLQVCARFHYPLPELCLNTGHEAQQGRICCIDEDCFAGEHCLVVGFYDPKFGECPGENVCMPDTFLTQYADAGLTVKAPEPCYGDQ